MRKLTDHIINPANDRIEITVMDEPGAGGAQPTLTSSPSRPIPSDL